MHTDWSQDVVYNIKPGFIGLIGDWLHSFVLYIYLQWRVSIVAIRLTSRYMSTCLDIHTRILEQIPSHSQTLIMALPRWNGTNSAFFQLTYNLTDNWSASQVAKRTIFGILFLSLATDETISRKRYLFLQNSFEHLLILIYIGNHKTDLAYFERRIYYFIIVLSRAVNDTGDHCVKLWSGKCQIKSIW